MKQSKIIMGMPVSVEIVDGDEKIFKKVFDHFRAIDEKFSPFKKDSEVSKFNRGEISEKEFSLKFKEILKLAEETKKETNGYFDIFQNGKMDPSGIVKGWEIYEAAKLISELGYSKYFVEAGGDFQTGGEWKVGIRNPFNVREIVKVLKINGQGVATSGNYERGEHIYDPHTGKSAKEIASMTVIAKNVYEADRFATAAFAMGTGGINFIERQKGLEGYMINLDGLATLTTGFEKYV